MTKVLSYIDGGERVRIRIRPRRNGAVVSTSDRIKISKALRRWARAHRSQVRQRRYWKGRRLSAEHRRRISQSIRRRRRYG